MEKMAESRTIFDFLAMPELAPAAVIDTERESVHSCFKALVEDDKYFHRHVTESFRGVPGLVELPLVEIKVAQSVVQVYTISDIYLGSSLITEWVKKKCRPAVIEGIVFNALVVSGNVSTSTASIRQFFEALSSKFDVISFIPGNHDLLLTNASEDKDCVQKLSEIYAALESLPKVHCGPVKLHYGEGHCRELLLLPLHAWHHASWDKEREIENTSYAALQLDPLTSFAARWPDNIHCRWPSFVADQAALTCQFGEAIHPHNAALAEAFAAQNENFLRPPPSKLLSENEPGAIQFFGCKYTDSCADEDVVHAGPVTVISFSHFLPRQELLPEKRFLVEPMLAKVCGSDVLASQVRRLQPHLHLCGHVHVPIDLTLQGIRYVRWPLRGVSKLCKPVADLGPLCVFDSRLGDGGAGIPANLASRDTEWSKYYADPSARQPDVVEPLAPWLLKSIEALKR